MEDQLTSLEIKVARVAALCQGLRTENASLLTRLNDALKSRDEHAAKLDAARVRIESLIERLPDANHE